MKEILKDLKNCWLSPSGRVIVDDPELDKTTSYHEALALCILRDIYVVKTHLDAFAMLYDKFKYSATEELEKLGYIRLQSMFDDSKPKWIFQIYKRLTKKQEKIIMEWCLINNIKYDSSIYDGNVTKDKYDIE